DGYNKRWRIFTASVKGFVIGAGIKGAYKRAVPVYLPVYLIPALIVHRQGLGKRIWTCFLFRIFKRCNVTMLALGTFPTGLSLAIEKKSRRIEISLYCLARAIESFFTTMSDIDKLQAVISTEVGSDVKLKTEFIQPVRS
ncbi:hypothetical protein M8C21_016940, partial [Ambrosia artemisiifolia]